MPVLAENCAQLKGRNLIIEAKKITLMQLRFMQLINPLSTQAAFSHSSYCSVQSPVHKHCRYITAKNILLVAAVLNKAEAYLGDSKLEPGWTRADLCHQSLP